MNLVDAGGRGCGAESRRVSRQATVWEPGRDGLTHTVREGLASYETGVRWQLNVLD